MIDLPQLQTYVLRPILKALQLHTAAAEALVMGTILKESHGGRYLHQLGAGPAVGICQMEPATYKDIWENYLRYRAPLVARLRNAQIVPMPADGSPPGHEQMIVNLGYAAAMCRLHYLRVPHPLPAAEDVAELANYWKQHYNTASGAGTAQEFIDKFNRYLGTMTWG